MPVPVPLGGGVDPATLYIVWGGSWIRTSHWTDWPRNSRTSAEDKEKQKNSKGM